VTRCARISTRVESHRKRMRDAARAEIGEALRFLALGVISQAAEDAARGLQVSIDLETWAALADVPTDLVLELLSPSGATPSIPAAARCLRS
jgi:hypothetical protein